jgi:hypothetical protein
LKTKAVLSPDGDYIKVTEPSIPTYLRKDVEAIHKLEGTVCIPVKREHKIIATDIKTKDWQQSKETILNLPEGVICKADYFGNTKGRLKNEFRTIQFKVSDSMNQVAPFLFWQISIDREARRLERQDSEDSEDPFAAAQKRMSEINIMDE